MPPHGKISQRKEKGKRDCTPGRGGEGCVILGIRLSKREKKSLYMGGKEGGERNRRRIDGKRPYNNLWGIKKKGVRILHSGGE